MQKTLAKGLCQSFLYKLAQICKYFLGCRSAISDKKLVIRFILDYDGYYFNGLEIDTVELGGKILDGEEKDNILIDIFMNNVADKETE